MTMLMLTEDRLRTIGGSSFDLESVSVAVGRNPESGQLKLTIRDERTGAARELKFNSDATEASVIRLIEHTAEEMGLVKAPARHED